MSRDPVVAAMEAAVAAQPEVVDLRVHLIGLLVERGRFADALTHCGTGLAQAPGDRRLLALLRQCTDGIAAAPAPAPPAVPQPAAQPPAPPAAPEFDWSAAEHDLGDVDEAVDPEPMDQVQAAGGDRHPLGADDFQAIARPQVTMRDVGGMVEVKKQLDLTLFGPLRNPELARAYHTTARGGLLLYGPPGCGKSFLATAVAGELGARFYSIEISDIMQQYFGQSEQAIHEIFQTARANAPCVLFFDELDALGHKRSGLRGDGLRPVVNQLLIELDSGSSRNDGVFVLGATNHPWDIDVALRRPGRFDRMVLVTPPDLDARAAILAFHLRDRPVIGVDLHDLARRTDGLTGADLMHVANLATQYAMSASIQSGRVEPVTTREIGAAMNQVRSSAGGWFETARSVLQFGNNDGSFDDLAAYLKRRR